MLNEEKIILMTKLAIYEKGEGKKEIPMSRYYRNDYVGVHMLYTFLAVTAGYVLLFALYIARDVEGFLSSLTTMDLRKFLFVALVIYAFAEQIFLLVTWMIYRQRFTKNREHLNEYNKNLKKLKKLQKKEEAAARKIAEGKEAEGPDEPKVAPAEHDLLPEEPEEDPEGDLFPEDSEEEDIFSEPEQQGYFRRRKTKKSRDDMDAADSMDDPSYAEDVAGGTAPDGETSEDDVWDLIGEEEYAEDTDLNIGESPAEDAGPNIGENPAEDTDPNVVKASADDTSQNDMETNLKKQAPKQEPPRTQAEHQDPDLLLDEVMKELLSYDSDDDDDEEDEDGFTFSS